MREQRLVEVKTALESDQQRVLATEQTNDRQRRELEEIESKLRAKEESVAQMSASVEKMQADLVQRKQEFEGQVAEMQTAMRESTSKARALELGQLETTHHTALLTAERDNALQQVQHLQRQVSDDAEAVDEVRKKLQEREVEMVRAAGAAASETEELRAAYDARIGSATEEAVALR